jgi:transposase
MRDPRRTSSANCHKIRWRIHEIDPTWQPPSRCLQRPKHLNKLAQDLAPLEGLVPRLCRELVHRCRELTEQISLLDKGISTLVANLAPSLLATTGCGNLTAATILGETAGVRRFTSRHAYTRHNGISPLPVWSGNRDRHQLSRIGNRRLSTALHRIAITQAHYH